MGYGRARTGTAHRYKFQAAISSVVRRALDYYARAGDATSAVVGQTVRDIVVIEFSVTGTVTSAAHHVLWK